MSSELRIIVLGMMGRCPYGGQTWLYLNWLRGLTQLGHDVWYVEDDTVWPYDPVKDSVTDDCAYAVQHIDNCLERIGLSCKWAYRLADRQDACWGLAESALNSLYRSCDVLLNIVGSTALRDEHRKARFRVYVETDPVTVELSLAAGDDTTWNPFSEHHKVATYGENYGAADCGVPLAGLDAGYVKTRQPIDLDLWPMAFDDQSRYFTTIGNYRQTGSDVQWNGETYYWSKHHEWEKFISLPQRTSQSFELAMMPQREDDRKLLQSHGWKLVSPLEMSLDVFGSYRDYFQKSRGEFTVAKDQNVRLKSGWFSERDACYLATGKPVITQDTGFSNVLPTGEGLFAFETIEEVIQAIDIIDGDYARHCDAARSIAREYFECKNVATDLLKDLGLN